MNESIAAGLDLGRALAAARLGLVDRSQLEGALDRCKAGSSIVRHWQATGALAGRGLDALLASAIAFGPPEKLSELIRSEVETSLEPYRPGDRLGTSYRIFDRSEGGFGCVYFCEALDSPDRKRVALKAPLRRRLADPRARELFYDEAIHWVSLPPHPNVVLAYGVEEFNRLPFIVAEYVESRRTLWDEICEKRTDWRTAVKAGAGVARGLAHARRAMGLAHNDIKPSNILMAPGGVKITDFGLSAIREAGAGVSLAGTPGYLAPEIYGGDARSEASDIYAFGVTLFQAAARAWPFDPAQPTLNRTMEAPDPRNFSPEIPNPLAEVVNRCLRRAPAERPSSFAELADRLLELHRELLGCDPPPDPGPDAPEAAEALINAAQSWLRLGLVDKGRAAATRAVAAEPGDWKAHNASGLVEWEARNAEAALAHFARAHELAPDELAPQVNAGLAADAIGRRDLSGEHLARALTRCERAGGYAALDPASSLIARILSPPLALRAMDRIVREQPRAGVTWNNRAVLLLRYLSRPKDALESAEKALELNPAYAKAWGNKANALQALGRPDEALRAAETAVGLDGSWASGHAAKITALASLGRTEEARRSLAEALRILPGDPVLRRVAKRLPE